MNAIREYLDKLTKQAARDAGIDPKGEARQELASHLFELAANRAAGRALTLADIDAAWAELAPKAVYLLKEDTSPATTAVNTPKFRGGSWFRRLAAYISDAVLVLGCLLTVVLVIEQGLGMDEEFALTFGFMTVLPAFLVILILMEVRRGGTPGKFMLRVRTVNRKGEFPRVFSALLVTVPKFFPPLLAVDILLGIITGFRDRARLTERIAQVRVITVT